MWIVFFTYGRFCSQILGQAVYTWMYLYLTVNCFTAQTSITYLLWYSSICCHSSSSNYSEHQQPVFTFGCQLFWQVWCCGCCCWLLLCCCCAAAVLLMLLLLFIWGPCTSNACVSQRNYFYLSLIYPRHEWKIEHLQRQDNLDLRAPKGPFFIWNIEVLSKGLNFQIVEP